MDVVQWHGWMISVAQLTQRFVLRLRMKRHQCFPVYWVFAKEPRRTREAYVELNQGLFAAAIVFTLVIFFLSLAVSERSVALYKTNDD